MSSDLNRENVPSAPVPSARARVLMRGITDGLELEQTSRDFEYTMRTRHVHGTYELYYLVEGERYYFIDRHTYLVNAGDVVLIPPHLVHKTTPAGSSYHNRVLLQITPDLLLPVLKACRLPDPESFLGGEALVLRIPEESRDALFSLFTQMGQTLRSQPRYYQSALRLQLGEVFLLLMQCRQDSREDRVLRDISSWKHEKVQEAVDYLRIHPETEESLDELAARFFVSRSYLSRIFREVTSFTVNEYRTACRIRKARELLTENRHSITEVSELVGFENVTYFDRIFKQYVGVSPLRYQKESRE